MTPARAHTQGPAGACRSVKQKAVWEGEEKALGGRVLSQAREAVSGTERPVSSGSPISLHSP